MAQSLPTKDQAVFRSIVKFYETKQYKKGIKAADSILKKNPDHGETLCMKGLTLSYLDKKTEAYDLVRKGLKHNIRSHVCWHVFGLLYRQDRDYFEAMKCYRQALRIDPDNIQILRDLSLLEIHQRDLGGFVETRRKLLQLKPSARLNWIGYAVSEHLCKNYEFAWTCLDNYDKTFKDEGVPEYEVSELYLYKASIMEEAGNLEQALECLVKHEKEIVDKLGLMEHKARLLMYLKRFDEAADLFRKLIRTNPEHHHYILGFLANQPQFHRFWPPMPSFHSVVDEGEKVAVPASVGSFPESYHPEGSPIWGWLQPQRSSATRQQRVQIGSRWVKKKIDTHDPVVPLTTEEEEAVCKFFDDLISDHPRSDSLKALLLYFVTGPRFVERLDAHLRPRIRKGIPALFRMLRPLYFQQGKAALIEELLTRYMKNLHEQKVFGPASGAQVAAEDVEEEPPSVLLFTQMMAAEHFDFVGDTAKALELVDQAIAHTPTLVELYACKARIYKHAGEYETSSKLLDEARQLDLADRFLNAQAVKGFFRIDDDQSGMEKALMFAKEPDSVDAANLHDMQSMWYELHIGRSYVRQRKWGKALKMFGETFKHFSDIAEDQFDFHNYCLRKTTLKTYVEMLAMQERLYSHKYFRRAAKITVNIHLEIFDMKARGEQVGAKKDEDDDDANMSAADKKKLKHKKQREQKANEAKKVAVVAVANGGKAKKVDEDPDGEKLLEKDGMEEAGKLLKKLVKYCGADPTTHVLHYEIASRQGRQLHCMQALLKLWDLSKQDSLNYKLVASLAHFCFVAKLDDEAMHSAVREVIMHELAPVLGQTDGPLADLKAMRARAEKIVDSVEIRLKEPANMLLPEVLASLKCMKHAGREQACTRFLDSWTPSRSASVKECQKMLRYIASDYGKETPAWGRFKGQCAELYPLMVVA